jgi:glycosyltransferase involved in cell wall biosynthesis
VASDRGALPETCGGAALLVEAHRPDLVADALLAACLDDTTTARLRAAGAARAAGFSWERTAQAVDAIVREELGSPR